MTGNDVLISWLNDAYAMEQSLITTLQNHASDATDQPQIQRRINEHVDETRRHADLVGKCVARLGGDTSSAKTAMGKLSGFFSGMSSSMSQDELVKNTLVESSSEHFEIASYKAIIAAAESLGHPDVVSTCQEILRDEERMAEWLDQNLPALVHEHLAVQIGV